MTATPQVSEVSRRAGMALVYRARHVLVLENSKVSDAEAVDPIGVYDPNYNDVRSLVRDYTTALNIVPKYGYEYIFATVQKPKDLSMFHKIIARPKSYKDVKLPVRLASEGR